VRVRREFGKGIEWKANERKQNDDCERDSFRQSRLTPFIPDTPADEPKCDNLIQNYQTDESFGIHNLERVRQIYWFSPLPASL